MTCNVETVLGSLNPNNLGRTLTHEHLSMVFSHFYQNPPKSLENKFNSGFSLNNVGYIRQYPYSSHYNLLLNDEDSKEAVLKDVLNYKVQGGGTIVENSTEGLKRNIEFYKSISKETNVHIVAGTGFYIADMQEEQSLRYTEEELYKHMLTELTEGCIDYPTVKAGFMGEIASVWPIKDFERKAIRAAGEVQGQVDVGVSFHPHREPEAPFEIIRLYLEAGGKAEKAVMSHLDRTLTVPEKLLEFSELGTYCQFDLFGTEVSFYQLKEDIDMLSDAQRMQMVRRLVNERKEDRILISHDIHTKHRLIEYGGHGYSHILTNVLPRLINKGISQDIIDKITIENPARWLAVKQM